MKTISNSRGVYDLVSKPLFGEEQEHLILVTVNSANAVTGIHWLCSGSDTSVTFSVKQVVRQAVINNARGICIVHNHPSGDPMPSIPDIKNTEDLKKALELFDITFMDHVIVSDRRYYSFSDGTVTVVRN